MGADADAQLLYGAYGYGGYAAAPYAYGAYPYAGAYAAGYGVTNAANTVGIAGVAPAALPAVAGGYAGAGRYVANSAGVVHVAKRSADAEPEADAYHGLMVLDMAMVVSMEDMDTVPMVPTPTPMVSTESRLLSALILIVLSYCEPKAQK